MELVHESTGEWAEQSLAKWQRGKSTNFSEASRKLPGGYPRSIFDILYGHEKENGNV